MMISLPGLSVLLPLMALGAVAPGPALLYLLSQTRRDSPRPGIVCAFGVATGLLVHGAALTFGCSQLIVHYPQLLSILQYAGVAYLCYLAFSLFQEGTQQNSDTSLATNSLSKAFLQSMLNSIVNPKTALFFLVVIPQFVSPSYGSIQVQFACFSLITTCVGLSCKLGVAYLAHLLAKKAKRPKPVFFKFQRIAFASIFAILALKLFIGFQ